MTSVVNIFKENNQMHMILLRIIQSLLKSIRMKLIFQKLNKIYIIGRFLKLIYQHFIERVPLIFFKIMLFIPLNILLLLKMNVKLYIYFLNTLSCIIGRNFDLWIQDLYKLLSNLFLDQVQTSLFLFYYVILDIINLIVLC